MTTDNINICMANGSNLPKYASISFNSTRIKWARPVLLQAWVCFKLITAGFIQFVLQLVVANVVGDMLETIESYPQEKSIPPRCHEANQRCQQDCTTKERTFQRPGVSQVCDRNQSKFSTFLDLQGHGLRSTNLSWKPESQACPARGTSFLLHFKSRNIGHTATTIVTQVGPGG